MRVFYYDIICPYAYMAFIYLKRFNVFKKQNIELKPILLGGLFNHLGQETNPNLSMSEAKASWLKSDFFRQAQFFNVSLKRHPRHPLSSVNALRLIYSCRETEREDITERLYEAYWRDNLDIDDEDVLKEIAKDFVIEKDFSFAKQALISATKDAFLNKVFGVPSLFINDRLYFGSDRLVLLKDELDFPWPDASWDGGEFDFYFDFSSPYSYLAWIEVKGAIEAGVKVHLKPLLLGALFKERGVTSIPMLTAHKNKAEYYLQDMKDWALYRNAPFTFSSFFPLRTVLPLRIALVDSQTVDALFLAAWAKNLDIGNETILAQILNEAGFDANELVEKAKAEEIKDQLKENTALALKQGIFGVPTFFVKDQQVFGQDRFSWIRQTMRCSL